MHDVAIRPHIVERVVKRTGKLHWFDSLSPRRTALLVIDMQTMFLAPGAPGEVPMAREICGTINGLADQLRGMGVPVIWVLHSNTRNNGVSDWEVFFNNVLSGEIRARAIDSLAPDKQTVWKDLEVKDGDVRIIKNRYSPFIAGASNLERVLRNMGVDTLLIAGTKTNVCCDAAARDAMMLDFQVVLLSDCTAALTDEEHLTTLENVIQQFGDVMTSAEALDALRRGGNS